MQTQTTAVHKPALVPCKAIRPKKKILQVILNLICERRDLFPSTNSRLHFSERRLKRMGFYCSIGKCYQFRVDVDGIPIVFLLVGAAIIAAIVAVHQKNGRELWRVTTSSTRFSLVKMYYVASTTSRSLSLTYYYVEFDVTAYVPAIGFGLRRWECIRTNMLLATSTTLQESADALKINHHGGNN
jgi:hypothetical protein